LKHGDTDHENTKDRKHEIKFLCALCDLLLNLFEQKIAKSAKKERIESNLPEFFALFVFSIFRAFVIVF